MSAICAILQRDGGSVGGESLERMMRAIDYWGPDGSGSWIDNEIALGHQMLHNTPQSPHDEQPLVSAADGVALTSAARLDNRDELLSAFGLDDDTIPDSRLIRLAYGRWGDDCVEHLQGDWAFALWDGRRRRLLVARDHHGISGLFYYQSPRLFAVCSSLKGLLALPGVPREADPFRLLQFLVAWGERGAPTCFHDVLRLPPAHAMTVTRESLRVRRFWRLEDIAPLRLKSDEEYVEMFREIYSDAVRKRLRHARPMAVLLSGGLDSGSVAAAAAAELRRSGQRLRAFTAIPAFDVSGLDPALHIADESPLVEAIARAAGNIDVSYHSAEQSGVVASMERMLELLEEPFVGENAFWVADIFDAARAEGLGGMLTGGAGNVTISYPGPRFVINRENWWRIPTVVSELRDWRATRSVSLTKLFLSQIALRLAPPPIYRWHVSRRRGWQQEPWRSYSVANPQFADEMRLGERMRQAGHDAGFASIDSRQIRLRVLKPGRDNTGAIYQSMAAGFGLEVRDPTVDRRVLEFCLAIPDRQHGRGGQSRLLIRRAMEGRLPVEVLNNRRRGIQAGDVATRLARESGAVRDAIERIERSPLACEMLDMPRIKDALLVSDGPRSDHAVLAEINSAVRGLATGLFLARFP